MGLTTSVLALTFFVCEFFLRLLEMYSQTTRTRSNTRIPEQTAPAKIGICSRILPPLTTFETPPFGVASVSVPFAMSNVPFRSSVAVELNATSPVMVTVAELGVSRAVAKRKRRSRRTIKFISGH